ncbi:MAG: hypothetical protein OEM41_01375 [Ignavibacteria bacterium]|nr:hypothetical protein [Ignavibacteria bacterium]
MHTLILTLKLLFYSYLGYLLFFLATGYHPEQAGYNPPFVIFVVDTINLFIHEAGHFFLKIFGKFINILGGSFFQILIPGLLVFTTWRQTITQIALPGFWLGESMVNVSVYIRDAPFRHLRLIARGLIHDWNWLLSGNMEAAEPLADIVFICGLCICAASLGAGVYFAVRVFREESLSVPG